jgi:cytochrome c peroxidase
VRIHDVKSKGVYDYLDEFDTPTLVEVWRTAPYLHDGSFATVKELLTEGRHGNADGRLDELDDGHIDDLVEFVLSL